MIMYSSFIVMCDLQIPGSTSCIAERLFDLHIASGSYVVEEKLLCASRNRCLVDDKEAFVVKETDHIPGALDASEISV